MKKYKCIIFDIDGTILDTEKMNLIPLKRLIKEVKGIDVKYEDLIFALALPGKETLRRLEFDNIEENYDKWVKYVGEYEKGAELYKGIDTVIKKLHKNNINLGIVSSKTKSQYDIDFLKTGLHECMKSVVLVDDTENHKPHPEPILKAINDIGCKKDDCIYVGDTLSDYICSKNVGIDFALATWGCKDRKGIKEEIELRNVEDLLDLID